MIWFPAMLPVAIEITVSSASEAGQVWRALRGQEEIHEAAIHLEGVGHVWTAFRLDGGRWSARREAPGVRSCQ